MLRPVVTSSALQRLLLMIALASTTGCRSPDGTVAIGLAGAWSKPHDSTALKGAELAVQRINSTGGLRGRMIELIVRDDSGSALFAARVAQQLVEDQSIVAVVGHMDNATTAAAAPIYNGSPTPVVHISPAASGIGLTDLGRYTFRVCPDDRAHGTLLAGWSRQQLGIGSAAILYRNTAQDRALAAAFRSQFLRNGGRIASADPYVSSLPSLEPYLTRVRVRGGADALVIAGTAEDATQITAAVDSARIEPTILTTAAMWVPGDLAASMEGTFISTYYLPTMSSPGNEDFASAYRQAYGSEPDHRAAGAYDIINILARAIRAVGFSRDRIREYLAGIGSRTEVYEGAGGPVAFDEHGNVTGRQVVMAAVHNGQLAAAPEQR